VATRFTFFYHWIAHPEIHDALSFLLTHASNQTHVVITTRTEPPLPLVRLRALNELLEIDASVLRFDLEETRRFLERERLDTLDPFELNLLLAQTEGRPAVLRIIASTSLQLGTDLGDYVRGGSAALRPIGAYLAELLGGLPPDMVQFMTQTSILDRLCAPLCRAVTGVESSRELLESMEVSRLLVAPLDQEGRWYRYHPLLAGHLEERLQTQFGDDVPWLHRRAYRWFAANELWTDAVQHAIAAGDRKQAVSWIENCAMALVKKGDLLTLLGWQRLFPTELMRGQIKARLAITSTTAIDGFVRITQMGATIFDVRTQFLTFCALVLIYSTTAIYLEWSRKLRLPSAQRS
jgi:LuxR family transcriptional regulator, maltose regulon positive regulatory protein